MQRLLKQALPILLMLSSGAAIAKPYGVGLQCFFTRGSSALVTVADTTRGIYVVTNVVARGDCPDGVWTDGREKIYALRVGDPLRDLKANEEIVRLVLARNRVQNDALEAADAKIETNTKAIVELETQMAELRRVVERMQQIDGPAPEHVHGAGTN